MRRRTPIAIILTAGLVASLVATAAGASPVLRWQRSVGKLFVGETTTLRIMLDDTLDVRTFEVRVEYDAGVLRSDGGEPGALFDGFDLYQGFEQETAGRWHGYCVVLGAEEWAVGPGELFRWTVTGLAEGSSPLVTVELGLRPPGGGDYSEVKLPATSIDVGDPTTVGPSPAVASLELFPNPFNPRVTLVIEAGGAGGSGRLEVFDARGRRVATPWSGGLRPGRLAVPWDGRDNHGRLLGGGVYLFQLRDDHGRRTIRRGTLVR